MVLAAAGLEKLRRQREDVEHDLEPLPGRGYRLPGLGGVRASAPGLRRRSLRRCGWIQCIVDIEAVPSSSPCHEPFAGRGQHLGLLGRRRGVDAWVPVRADRSSGFFGRAYFTPGAARRSPASKKVRARRASPERVLSRISAPPSSGPARPRPLCPELAAARPPGRGADGRDPSAARRTGLSGLPLGDVGLGAHGRRQWAGSPPIIHLFIVVIGIADPTPEGVSPQPDTGRRPRSLGDPDQPPTDGGRRTLVVGPASQADLSVTDIVPPVNLPGTTCSRRRG